MFLIACDGTETTGSIISTTDAYYRQVREDVTGCITCKRTRKCSAYGVWFVISDGCIWMKILELKLRVTKQQLQ